jgi:hypothetical protein
MRAHNVSGLLALALALTLVACSTSNGVEAGAEIGTKKDGPPGQGFGSANESDTAANASVGGCTKMDIVFVIDNSGSMEEEQETLAKNFPEFAKVIDDYRSKSGGPLDYRIAVTTTDVTDDGGSFRTTGDSCNAGPNRPWLERGDQRPAATLACRASVGTEGSGTERPLEAARLSLTERIADGTNGSFLRDDALLALIVLTDEDEELESFEEEGEDEDEPGKGDVPGVDAYVAVFDQLKKDRSRWAAAVIAGDRNCTTELGEAEEATHLKDFTTKAGKNASFSSICSGDLKVGLERALGAFDMACQDFGRPPK